MRFRFHIAGVLILVLITLVLILSNNGLFNTNDSNFAIDSKEEIERIEIESGEDRLVLSESSGGWLVNAKWPAREPAIDFLIKTLRGLEVKSTVSDELFKSEITNRDINPVEVKVYGARKMLSGFMIFRTENIPGGNIVKKNTNSKPYIVHLPGYDLNPGAHFVTDIRFWRPYSVFDLSNGSIESVSLAYGGKEEADIMISSNDTGYVIMLKGKSPDSVDTTSIRRYLAYFSYVPFERWAFDLEEAERLKIVEQVPEFRIGVKFSDGRSVTFFGWQRIISSGESIEYDTDRIWGSVNNGDDIFIARYFDIDPLLKSVDYFSRD
ncbi:MAG TPA: hypothetical protein VMW76_07595 [Bacteroidales bacterium]|nr:hypothetical protein [Bacteroidales bacterium]